MSKNRKITVKFGDRTELFSITGNKMNKETINTTFQIENGMLACEIHGDLCKMQVDQSHYFLHEHYDLYLLTDESYKRKEQKTWDNRVMGDKSLFRFESMLACKDKSKKTEDKRHLGKSIPVTPNRAKESARVTQCPVPVKICKTSKNRVIIFQYAHYEVDESEYICSIPKKMRLDLEEKEFSVKDIINMMKNKMFECFNKTAEDFSLHQFSLADNERNILTSWSHNGKLCSIWEWVKQTRVGKRYFEVWLLSKLTSDLSDSGLKKKNTALANVTNRVLNERPSNSKGNIHLSDDMHIALTEKNKSDNTSSSGYMGQMKTHRIPRLREILEGLHLNIELVEEDQIVYYCSKPIGEGGFGKVYKGDLLGTPVAVKVIDQTHDDDNKYIVREIISLAKCRHPNVVSLMAVHINYDSTCYIITELLNGKSLRVVLFNPRCRVQYNLTNADRNKIGEQLCDAVSFMHSKSPKICHKDIKPENIVINALTKDVKIVDLGASKTEDMPAQFNTCAKDDFHGTYYYAAPESFSNDSIGPKADVWGIGCVTCELYSEDLVWSNHLKSSCELKENLIELFKTNPIPNLEELPTEIKSLTRKCFKIDPSKRPDASSMRDAFRSIGAESD